MWFRVLDSTGHRVGHNSRVAVILLQDRRYPWAPGGIRKHVPALITPARVDAEAGVDERLFRPETVAASRVTSSTPVVRGRSSNEKGSNGFKSAQERQPEGGSARSHGARARSPHGRARDHRLRRLLLSTGCGWTALMDDCTGPSFANGGLIADSRFSGGVVINGSQQSELVHRATIAVVGEVPLQRLWHATPCFPTHSEIRLCRLEESWP
jgi:hypothetical protein